MSLTATLQATLGRSSTSHTRQVVAVLAPASKASTHDAYGRYLIRKDALDGTPNTTLPITIGLGQVATAHSIVIRVTGAALLEFTTQDADTTSRIREEPIGSVDQPEGVYVSFGATTLTQLDIKDVFCDGTEVEAWIMGIE